MIKACQSGEAGRVKLELKNKSPQREAIRKQIKADIPVLFGFDCIDTLKELKRKGEPFLFADHAYFDRGYERGNFRLIYNDIHQTHVYDLPNDRAQTFKIKLRNWQDNDGRIVFIPSPVNPMSFHKDMKWNENALDLIRSKTKREIYIKSQKTKGLGDSIHKAFCLVSHCSVAAVEAACSGIPVVSGKESPAYLISTSLECVESPVRPDRTMWANTLAYSQFTLTELKNGTAWAIVKEINGL